MPLSSQKSQSGPSTSRSRSKLDLSSAPAIFILSTHLQTDELHEAEDVVYQAGGNIVYKPTEAKVFLGRIAQKKRAAFDLRARDIWTLEDENFLSITEKQSKDGHIGKRRKIDLESDNVTSQRRHSDDEEEAVSWPDMKEHILVIKLDWLDESIHQGKMVSFIPYMVYSGKIVSKSEMSPTSKSDDLRSPPQSSPLSDRKDEPSSILARAEADPSSSTPKYRRFNRHSPSSSPTLTHKSHPPKLHRTTTSEFEESSSSDLPPLPEWATSPHAIYACCRSTPSNPVNIEFISQLRKIKQARLLTLDEIGVRAYSTSIASLSAYPHKITSPQEITRLPGCDVKIASLWSEWHSSSASDSTRTLKVVQDIENDPDLTHLTEFWNIWGVGPETARKFYFERGWKDLDDIVEFGWNTLSRVQQIGLKHHEEFLNKIPRKESEHISDVVLFHANKVRNTKKMQGIIVGGYRRGKSESNDVDIIITHQDESMTQDLIIDLVRSLEASNYITHTLTLHTSNSDRGQATLPYRGTRQSHHQGFDSLDKALCVWLEPTESSKSSSSEKKDSRLHRRVDIIISPWKTVGCAVLGWSGETTFQRDIRRFVSKTKGWKFDSSGVRERGQGRGRVLDLESSKPTDDDDDGKDTWQARERRLMNNLGIGYRDPPERCTG